MLPRYHLNLFSFLNLLFISCDGLDPFGSTKPKLFFRKLPGDSRISVVTEILRHYCVNVVMLRTVAGAFDRLARPNSRIYN